ncbi:hypothetical protein [Wenyingzhuangia sp. IMCC45574]
MKRIEKLAVKLYTGAITLEVFTSELYSETVVLQMDSNAFVYDLMEIDFKRDFLWRYRLKEILDKRFHESLLLARVLKEYALQIVESKDFNQCYNAVEKVSLFYGTPSFFGFTADCFYLIEEIDEWNDFNNNNEFELSNFYRVSKEFANDFLIELEKVKTLNELEKLIDYCSGELSNDTIIIQEEERIIVDNNVVSGIPNHSIPECITNERKYVKSFYLDKREGLTRKIIASSFWSFICFFLIIFSFRMEWLMYGLLVGGIMLLLISLYNLKMLSIVNKEIKQT